MITKQQKEKILKLAKKQGQEKIAKELGITRHQVRRILRQQDTQDNMSPAACCALDQYKNEIIVWMQEKNMSAFLIHQRLSNLKANISLRTVQRYVKSLKTPEVYVPIHSKPGEEGQVDYGYLGKFNKDGKMVKVWAFNMVLSYSRYAFYTIVTEQNVSSFVHCHQQAFEFFGGSPASVKIDNLGAGVIDAAFYQSEFQQTYYDFLQHYGVTAVNARVNRPQDKGKVEAGIKYIKQNLIPSLPSQDYYSLKEEVQRWNNQVCNLRVHRVTRKIPSEVFGKEEKKQLYSLPIERFRIIIREKRTVDACGHIYFRYNFYSVPYHLSGETVVLEIGEKTFTVLSDNAVITTHVIDTRMGVFITFDCHQPLYKQVKATSHYLEQLRPIGESAIRLFELLKAERPYHWKNMVKGIISLRQVYSASLIEDACMLTIADGKHDYKHVRILCQSIEKERKTKPKPKICKGINGYYHDLKVYMKLVNKPQPTS